MGRGGHIGCDAAAAHKVVPLMLLRIIPASMVVRRPHRMIERHVVAYRRQWLIVVSGFIETLPTKSLKPARMLIR